MLNSILIFICSGILLFILNACSPTKNPIPNTAIIPVAKLEDDFYDWYERHESVKKHLEQTSPNLMFIGDSITHMYGGIPASKMNRGESIWQKYYSERNAINLGFGWDRTQNVIWRLQNGELNGVTPKVVVLLIGTNNLVTTENAKENIPSEIAAGTTRIIEIIHTKSPQTHIVLLGLLPRKPAEKFAKRIQQVNALTSTLDKRDYVTFVDIGPLLSDKYFQPLDKVMSDSTHLNSLGYEIWASAIEPIINKQLK